MTNPITFGELFELYYNKHALIKTRCPENARYFLSGPGQRWKDVPLRDITNIDVQDWCDEIALTSKSMATRSVNMLSIVFNWGIKRGYVKIDNPCKFVERFKIHSRERFLSIDEIERFKSACDQEAPIYRDFFLVALATGARKSNILKLKWEELDLVLGHWMIPASEMKNGCSHVIPLTGDAIAILKRRQLEGSCKNWVFPSRKAKDGHLSDVKVPFARIIKRANIANLTVHDLRRTVGSHLAIQGESPYVIGAMMGHGDQRSTAVYARLNLTTVRRAAESMHQRWQLAPAELKERMTPKPVLCEVIPDEEKPAPEKQEKSKRTVAVERRVRTLINSAADHQLMKSDLLRGMVAKRRVRAFELDQVLSDMIENGTIERIWGRSDSGQNVQFYRLVSTQHRGIEWDSVVGGLGIRRNAHSSKWILKFKANGQHWFTLGDTSVIGVAAARKLATQMKTGMRTAKSRCSK